MVEEIAKELGRKPIEIALAWLRSKPGITSPIIGPGKVKQLKELVNSLSLKLTVKHIERLEKPYKPKEIAGHSASALESQQMAKMALNKK